MDANAPVILAEQLKTRGLSVIRDDGTVISTQNPLHPDFVEAVDTQDGRYAIAWGYEFGESGDEIGTAARLAFLLGVPTGLAAQGAKGNHTSTRGGASRGRTGPLAPTHASGWPERRGPEAQGGSAVGEGAGPPRQDPTEDPALSCRNEQFRRGATPGRLTRCLVALTAHQSLRRLLTFPACRNRAVSRTAFTVAAYAVALGVLVLQLGFPRRVLRGWPLRSRVGGARTLICGLQKLDDEAFAATVTEHRTTKPAASRPQPSRAPDRATLGCVGFGLCPLALISTTLVSDDVPWSHRP